MKNIKSFLLATVLAFVLIAGQPHAIMASTQSSTTGLVTASYHERQPFSLVISKVADNLDDMYPVATAMGARVYELVSESGAPTVRLTVNLAGYTVYKNSTGDENNYGGKLYAIVNGEVLQGTRGATTSSVTLNLGFADNVVTFFYVGREQNGALKYASDTVVVRVAADAGDFDANPYTAITVPVTSSAKNTAGSSVNATGLLATNLVTGYSIDRSVSPVDASGLTLSYTSAAGKKSSFTTNGFTAQNAFISSHGAFDVGGSYNGAGFTNEQNVGFNYDAGEMFGNSSMHTGANVTKGHVFVSGLDGVHLLGSGTTVGMASSNLSTTSVGSPIAAFVLADLGFWDVAQDLYGAAGGDWDAVVSTYGTTDFAVSGAYAMLFSQTITVNVSTVDSTPGFGIVVSLFTVGVIAYIAPRMRKD